MSLTGFNRARRAAAEKVGKSFEEVSYEEAIAILQGTEPDKSATEPQNVADLEPELESQSETETVPISRDDRTIQLKDLGWEALRDLLKSYELPTNKPKGVSWDDFAIPQILEHEGL